MSRIVPLWRSNEVSIHRFDHPAEHEDQPYQETAGAYMASFVERGEFNLEVGDARWRVNAGDVMLHHPGMTFRAGFEERFNDTCLSVTYLAARDEAFDADGVWGRRHVVANSNRVRFLRWGLQRAIRDNEPMLAEYCASEIFHPHDLGPRALYSEHKFHWYAERIHAARETLDRTLDEPHTVSALARAAGMSLFHFTRVFTELVGAPPHRYLTSRRLRAARAMLREGRGVTETCHACGFNNLSHFSRSFSRAFGTAPSLA